MAPSDLLQQWIEHIPKGRALDIGAGEGEVALWLAEQGFQVDAIERDPEICTSLEEVCAGLDVRIHSTDVREYEFHERVYSLVYAGAVLHFIKPTDLWTLADRIFSSILPGGFLIAEVFTTDDPGYDAMRRAGAEEIEPNTFLSPEMEGPIHYFVPGELARTFSMFELQMHEESRFLDVDDPVGYRSGAIIVARKKEY